MKIAFVVATCLALLIIIVVVVGYSLPARHRAQGEATINANPEQVFTLITHVEGFPSWRTKLTTAEILPSTDGKRHFREVSGNSRIQFVFETVEPPHRLVARIDDKSLPFGGAWTYELTPADSGRTRLQITEDGEIYNPVFRFISRFILGYRGTIDRYLADVASTFSARA